ncbi:MAG: SHOCT domain-containing protein, partial [Sulfurimonadaceae bacterium]
IHKKAISMKNRFTTLAILLITLLLAGCAKTPFKAHEPLANAALVYVYVAMDDGINDTERNPYYKVGLNGKNVKDGMLTNEYMAFNLKPETVVISAIRANIEKQELTLHLKAGETRYLKVQSFSDDFGKFSFEEVSSEVGAKEIANTRAAVEEKKEDDYISVLVESISSDEEENATVVKEDVAGKDTAKSEQNDADELERLFELKEKGAITQEEYETLKAKVINKQ